ncbi:hypothetical protein MA16_Dca023952 [Dendrobium catenatum]|uniref:Uncharacterized protein n=1 Tax=Dendrobium catenatum TaxID=906689 RepID=A0A2I0VJJ9_9ASPA|nr:hypothetical protein MA16_Dca023952 [Dendrobium catenatum]
MRSKCWDGATPLLANSPCPFFLSPSRTTLKITPKAPLFIRLHPAESNESSSFSQPNNPRDSFPRPTWFCWESPEHKKRKKKSYLSFSWSLLRIPQPSPITLALAVQMRFLTTLKVPSGGERRRAQ